MRQFLKAAFSRVHNIVFYKIFALFVIAITIPVVCVSALSIRHSTESIVYQVSQSNIESLEDKKSIVEQRIKEAENLAYQVFNSKSIAKLIRSAPYPTETMMLIYDLLDEFKSITIANEWLYSIYICIPEMDIVISDSKYTLDKFIDQYAIDMAMSADKSITRRRLDRTDVITYSRNLKSITFKQNIIIVANMNYNTLFNLSNDKESSAFDTLIFDGNLSEILLSGDNLASVDADTIGLLARAEATSGIYLINGVDYFACRVYSSALDWTFVYLQPYSALLSEASLISKLIVSSLIIVLMLSFVLAYIVSIYIYNPIGKLANKVSDHMPDMDKPANAYKVIDEAIIKLYNNNSELMTKYQQVLPFVKQHTLNDFLSGELFDMRRFMDILNLFGIRFTHARYVNIVLDIESQTLVSSARDLITAALSDYSDKLAHIMFNISVYRLSLIINTDMDENGICDVIRALKQNLNAHDIELTIAVGGVYDDISNVYPMHQEALALIRDKFFAGKNQIILSKDKRRRGEEFMYDKKLEAQLIACVTQSLDAKGASDALEELIEKASGSFSSIEYIRYVYFQVINRVIEAMNDMGFDLSKTGISSERAFETVQGSDTIYKLKQYAEGIISDCVKLIEEYKNAQHVVIADKVKEYLEANYAHDISLSEVAEEVYLSPGYVNGIFKSVAGRTIYEYVTNIRMEKAAELLADGALLVQDIADMVGYNNMQSFFRLFKQHYRMTPAEYRRRLKGI